MVNNNPHVILRKHSLPKADGRQFLLKLSGELAVGVEQADEAATFLFSKIIRCLGPVDAMRFAAQLPGEFQTRLAKLPPGPDFSLGEQEVLKGLASRLDVGIDGAKAAAHEIWTVLFETADGKVLSRLLYLLPSRIRAILRSTSPGVCRDNLDWESVFAP